ncbi:oligosaccharide flippase family protein [Photobacterium sp. CCB-ST2H9]|uniref:oligosaccharide flippase family protein n=1 Tax=Photobacterium sp. CCB-ST2H9 TaxID=2912855 RepID=UPI0020053185|nr:oligosaccharide flippase family protein [Photobacterium sp. CCB-ST2H9]UTM58758.1 oligosaccharide flippase family protein [Photobacterium sp. CCB-ST2H9]
MDSLSEKTGALSGYLRSGFVIMLSSLVLGFIADYLFNLTLSHALPAHQYGDYKVAYAFAVLSSVIILLGGDRIAPRILAAAIENQNRGYVLSFLRFYTGIALLLSVLLIAATYLAGVLHLGKTDLSEHHPLMLISFVIPLIACGALFSRVLQSAKMLALSNLPWRIGLPLIKAGTVAFLMISISQVELWQVILSGGIAVAGITFWQWRKIQTLGLIDSTQAIPPLAEKRQLLSWSVPMMLTMLITMALNQIDLFMLEILADENSVGHFAAATTTAHLLPVAQVTIAGIFLPLIGRTMDNDPEQAKALFWRAQKIITLSVLVLASGELYFGGWLLSFFGNDFQQAEQTLYWLIAAYAIWGFSGFASTWLQYSHYGRNIVIIGILTLIADISANFWLIPAMGMQGAAIATCLAMSLAAATTWYTFAFSLRQQPIEKETSTQH